MNEDRKKKMLHRHLGVRRAQERKMRSPNIERRTYTPPKSKTHSHTEHTHTAYIHLLRNDRKRNKRRKTSDGTGEWSGDDEDGEYLSREEWRKLSFLLFILLYNVYAYASMGNEGTMDGGYTLSSVGCRRVQKSSISLCLSLSRTQP